MSIKSRLILSYIGMLIIPCVLIVGLRNIFVAYLEGNPNSKTVKIITTDRLGFSREIGNKMKVFSKKVNNDILEDSDLLAESSYLKELDDVTSLSYTGILLRKNDDILYVSKDIKSDVIARSLPDFASEEYEYKDGERHGTLDVLSQQDFYFKDGSKGSIFYIFDYKTFRKIYKDDIAIIIIATIAVLVFTNGLLTYLVSRSIIKPLKGLENAANNIKHGDLDSEIKTCSKNEIGEVYGAFEDMRLRLKESLEIQQQYEENRKELISNISHDLKSPITSIKGYVEGIRDGIADSPDKMNKYINTIYNKSTYMDSLIDDLFLFSKLDLNKVPFDFQVVDIVSYLKDCVDEIKFDFDKNDIGINAVLPDKSILVNIDVQQLKRVIINIINNSIKYRGVERLNINISAEEENGKVMVAVKDNGKGISEKALPFIFDRFYRGELSRETTSGGSGLGLAIVKKIIEGHGGSIWAESILGKETTITFSLDIWDEVK